MITKVHIENFRCFRKTEISDFARINLIGGLNNAGKTAFLEALLLNSKPSLSTLQFLRKLRGESDEYAKLYPASTWDYLFYNQNKEAEINLVTTMTNEKEYTVNIVCKEKGEYKTSDNLWVLPELIDGYFSVLVIHANNNDNTRYQFLSDNSNIYRYKETYSMNEGQGIRVLNDDIPPSYPLHFIPAVYKKSGAELAKEYSKAERVNQNHLIREAIQLADSNITEVNVSVLNGINLVLRRANENSMPVAMFGDAINKIVNIILAVVNNNSSILVIDEVENGIHYTVQRDFWTYLFKLAKAFDIQVFATTHSLEMIQSFADIAGEYEPEDAAYYEFFRHVKTHEITANRHTIDTLKYELTNNLAIRGE